ncbi:MAG: DotU family type IV/VI secretion system protein [Magnetospirillum sp.]|nr:DotU family type IV/VI secretion system protein [Magnetospirillum sp.]
MGTLTLSRPARAAMQRFLAFHAELVEVKRLAAATLVHAETVGEGEGGIDVAARVRPEQMGVVDLFLRLRVAICPQGTPVPGADGLPDIGYVMAALADEALLHEVDWPGRDQWMGTLLEMSLYHSRVSGEEVFAIAHGIVDGSVVGRPDLAAAILLALSLGFRGRWRGLDDHGAIDELRRQLYEILYRQPAGGIDWRGAMPDALGPVLSGGSLHRVARLTPWLVAMAVSALATLALADWIWGEAINPVLALAADIRLLGGRF